MVSLAFGPSSHTISSAARPFLARAHIVGNHADRIVEMHDLVHAFDGQRLAVVDAFQLAAQHRTGGDGADLHARHLHIDAVDRRAVDLVGRVEPLGRRADQLEVLGILERDLLRRRQRRSLVDQRAVGERAPGRPWITLPFSARQVLRSTPHWFAAAAISMVRAVAPARRRGS